MQDSATGSARRPAAARAAWLAGAVPVAIALAALAWWWLHSTRPDAILRRGQQALQQGDRRSVEDTIARLSASGHDDQAHLLRGQLLVDDNRFGEALAEFNQIRGEGALRLEAAALSGQCLVRLKEYREAERVFAYVLAEQPDHVEAHRGLAVVYYDQGASIRALEHLERVAALDPGTGRTYWLMGVILEDQPQDLARAVSCYQNALRCDLPADIVDSVRLDLSRLLVRLSRYEEALQTLDGLDAERRASGRALALRAESLWALGRAREAIDQLESGLAQNPRDLEQSRVRAQIHLSAGEARQAARLLERILQEDPYDQVSRVRLAQAYEALGRGAEAAEQRRQHRRTQDLIEELSKLNRQALEQPWDPAVRRKLAEVCRQLGKQELSTMWSRAADAAERERK